VAPEDNQGDRMKTTSDSGILFLVHNEGIRYSAYPDSKGLLTIGVGHLVTPAEKTSGNLPIDGVLIRWKHSELTRAQVEALLRQDLKVTEAALRPFEDDLHQAQYDALISFIFNIGTSAFRKSTVYKRLTAGRLSEVPKAMGMWRKPVELVPRRMRECKLFVTGEYF
jgi:lysozyme